MSPCDRNKVAARMRAALNGKLTEDCFFAGYHGLATREEIDRIEQAGSPNEARAIMQEIIAEESRRLVAAQAA